MEVEMSKVEWSEAVGKDKKKKKKSRELLDSLFCYASKPAISQLKHPPAPWHCVGGEGREKKKISHLSVSKNQIDVFLY